MKWLGKICRWLHRLFMGDQQYPQGSPQSERVLMQRVLGAIQAINACLPQTGDNNSGTSAATSGLINGCTTLSWAFSVFVLQMQVFCCWIWGIVNGLLTTVATLATQASVDALQAEIDAINAQLPPEHPIGTPQVTALPAAGTSPTLNLESGSTDTDGFITLVLGSSPTAGGGLMIGITFANPFTNTCRCLLTCNYAVGPNRGMIANVIMPVSGGFSSLAFAVFDPAAGLVQSSQVRLNYSIRQLLP